MRVLIVALTMAVAVLVANDTLKRSLGSVRLDRICRGVTPALDGERGLCPLLQETRRDVRREAMIFAFLVLRIGVDLMYLCRGRSRSDAEK